MFQKNQKNLLHDETVFTPKTIEKIDPKDNKATSKIKV